MKNSRYYGEKLGLELTDKQCEMLDIYMDMVIEKNKVMNLTALTSPQDVAVKHLVLVPEQIEFRYRCRELIYNILAENGFTIPFPQRDVHMIPNDK